MKLPLPTEYQECLWLVEYLNILKIQKKVLMYTHIPNETYTKYWSQKIKNKKMGVSGGFLDYVILLNNGIVFLEMKRVKGGQISENQKAWIDALHHLGFSAIVCNGFKEAQKEIEKLL